MNETQAVDFLNALRAKQIHVKDNGWVTCSCLLARWTHKGHADSSPSFGISITPGGRSHFLCFACRQGSAEELLGVLQLYSQNSPDYDFARCYQILANEVYVVPLPEYSEFPLAGQTFQAWPAYWVDSFVPAHMRIESALYLAGRGVLPPQIEYYQLKFDAKRQMVVAPYWDAFGRLAGARGRSIHPDAKFKHYDYTYQGVNNARFCWYNEIVLNQPGPVVVVEGQFDCLRTVQAFPKTVANLTAKPTLEKMKKLGDCGTVIQIPDRDEAGEQSVGVYAKFCAQLGLTHRIVYLDEGCKDPGDAHVDYLQDRIQECL